MKSADNAQSVLPEILFEKSNKLYGACLPGNQYPVNILTRLLMAVSVPALMIFIFISGTQSETRQAISPIKNTVSIADITVPVQPDPGIPDQLAPVMAASSPGELFTTPLIVEVHAQIGDSIPTVNELDFTNHPATVLCDVVQSPGNIPALRSSIAGAELSDPTTDVFGGSGVDELAGFPGG